MPVKQMTALQSSLKDFPRASYLGRTESRKFHFVLLREESLRYLLVLDLLLQYPQNRGSVILYSCRKQLSIVYIVRGLGIPDQIVPEVTAHVVRSCHQSRDNVGRKATTE